MSAPKYDKASQNGRIETKLVRGTSPKAKAIEFGGMLPNN